MDIRGRPGYLQRPSLPTPPDSPERSPEPSGLRGGSFSPLRRDIAFANIARLASDSDGSPVHPSCQPVTPDSPDYRLYSPPPSPRSDEEIEVLERMFRQKVKHTTRNENADVFRRRPALRPKIKPVASWASSRSNASMDRFLPAQRRPETSTQSFHANKDPKKLTPAERIIRREEASPDAFNPRHRRATSPNPPPNLPTRQVRRAVSGVRPGSATTLIPRADSVTAGPLTERQVSVGTVWTVGGLAPTSAGVTDGRGGLTGSGTNAPLYTTSFSSARPRAEEEAELHESRLAMALDLDRAQRVFDFTYYKPIKRSVSSPSIGRRGLNKKTVWAGTEWVMDAPKPKVKKPQEMRNLPAAPFKVLDAPHLRDDFYCSVLAYCHTSRTLAVGLGSMLYAWSESQGVQLLHGGSLNASWLTSVAFSSTEGKKSILAFGRSDGSVTLLSLFEVPGHRFIETQPCPVACISWKPTVTMRPSRHPHNAGRQVPTEDLIVGDEIGNVYYYAVEWPTAKEVERDLHHWKGCVTLLARISVHTQQICGLSWAHDGSVFATGGNDNLCCLFETTRILRAMPGQDSYIPSIDHTVTDGGQRELEFFSTRPNVKFIVPGAEKHRWVHGAAVKAIAFCPWREGLIATGGGSNDKCIHFFHTVSGACLATISVSAQVTSLIWSTTRREIAATFGYAQPEHPYRIAVFSWPDCKQVAAIPWEGEHRALYAIAYPGGPNDGRGRSRTVRQGAGPGMRSLGSSLSRTAQEGCIVVAASDESVKFHEVWTAGQRATEGGEGLLGGSDILEGLEGIDKEGDVIR